MVLSEWDAWEAPEGDPGQSCVFQLSFNFLCLLILQGIYLNGLSAGYVSNDLVLYMSAYADEGQRGEDSRI